MMHGLLTTEEELKSDESDGEGVVDSPVENEDPEDEHARLRKLQKLERRRVAEKYKFEHSEGMIEILEDLKRDKQNQYVIRDIYSSSELAKHDYLVTALKEYFEDNDKDSKCIVFASTA